jgi:spermidine synthase
MIEIAQKYFHIGKVKDLTIVNQDAVEFIKKTKQNLSLILMDCYQGFKTPAGFVDVKVLQKMKRVGDNVLLNRLYWDEHKTATDEFVAKISHHFRIKSVYTASNLIISIS